MIIPWSWSDSASSQWHWIKLIFRSDSGWRQQNQKTQLNRTFRNSIYRRLQPPVCEPQKTRTLVQVPFTLWAKAPHRIIPACRWLKPTALIIPWSWSDSASSQQHWFFTETIQILPKSNGYPEDFKISTSWGVLESNQWPLACQASVLNQLN